MNWALAGKITTIVCVGTWLLMTFNRWANKPAKPAPVSPEAEQDAVIEEAAFAPQHGFHLDYDYHPLLRDHVRDIA